MRISYALVCSILSPLALLHGASAQVVLNGTFDERAYGNGQNGHGGDPVYFSTDIVYTPPVAGGNTTENQYTIAASAYPWHPQQPLITPFGDHTTGSGRYLIVNGSTSPGAIIWEQTISGFTVGATYAFEGWTSTWTNGFPASPYLSIDGVAQGDVLSSYPQSFTWFGFTREFTALAPTLSISIRDYNTNATGNDPAFDDFKITGAVTPEPATNVALALGFVAILRRKRTTVSEPSSL